MNEKRPLPYACADRVRLLERCLEPYSSGMMRSDRDGSERQFAVIGIVAPLGF